MYKNILVPVDGSESSAQALKHAIKLAQMTNAKITLFHVMYFPAELEKSSVKLGEAYYLMKDRIKEHAQEILEKVRKDLSANNISFAEKTVWGEPASKIIQEAEQGKYDLLVIGSRGLGEIRSWLLGSVSQRVVRHCKCPVFLIR